MARWTMDVRTNDGPMDVHLFAPDHPGRSPTVILYVDAAGVRPAMLAIAERLCDDGYFVAVPNVFYRAGAFEPFDLATVWSDPSERARIRALIARARPEAVMKDSVALLEALSDEPRARTDRVGCIGYCMGGRLAFTAAGSLGDRVAASACIHGGHIATDEPDSPHLLADRVRSTLYFGVAADDPSCDEGSIAKLEAALRAASVPYELEMYAAAHGFAVKDAPTYDEAAAERHWMRVRELFARALPR